VLSHGLLFWLEQEFVPFRRLSERISDLSVSNLERPAARRRADATDRLAVSVEAHVTVSALSTERRSLLEQFARRLLEKEVVVRDELQALLAGGKLS
jgi:hypothetical protein